MKYRIKVEKYEIYSQFIPQCKKWYGWEGIIDKWLFTKDEAICAIEAHKKTTIKPEIEIIKIV